MDAYLVAKATTKGAELLVIRITPEVHLEGEA